MRYIEVKKCGIGHCPYCLHSSMRETKNYCSAIAIMPWIDSKIKTFPKWCPLDKPKSK